MEFDDDMAVAPTVDAFWSKAVADKCAEEVAVLGWGVIRRFWKLGDVINVVVEVVDGGGNGNGNGNSFLIWKWFWELGF